MDAQIEPTGTPRRRRDARPFILLAFGFYLFATWLAFLRLTAGEVERNHVHDVPVTRTELRYPDDGSIPDLVQIPGTVRCTQHVARGTWGDLDVHVAQYLEEFTPDADDTPAVPVD